MIAARQIFRRAVTALLLVVASTHLVANWSMTAEVAMPKRGDFNESIQSMLERFCYDCHGRKEDGGRDQSDQDYVPGQIWRKTRD